MGGLCRDRLICRDRLKGFNNLTSRGKKGQPLPIVKTRPYELWGLGLQSTENEGPAP